VGPVHENTPLSERLRVVRKRRGLTQRELANRSGVSYSLIGKIEEGERENTRLETLHKLAIVLRVPTSALAAGPDAAEPERTDVEEWAPVRRALEGSAEGEPPEEPTLEGLRAAFASAVPLLIANHYADVRVLLPPLLRDADVLVATSVNGAQSAARQLRAQIRQVAALLMSHTWQFDVAEHAIEMALDDAGDTLTAMSVVDEQCWGLIRAGRLAETRDLAARWADDSEPRVTKGTRDELAAWGRFLLRLSTAAARDNRPGEAQEALKFAKVAAIAVGSEFALPYNPWQVFGPATVAVIQAENAIVQDRPDVTLGLAEHLDVQRFPVSRHYYRHRLDVARAHVSLREYGDAVGVLEEVRRAAPEWLVQQRYARDILSIVIARRRTLTAEMRELADFLRLPM
jgi:transcriptional regulator with XRE-family HTH domain